MDYLSTEWLIEWARAHCKTADELGAMDEVAAEEVKIVLGDLSKLEVTTEPITFYASDFATIKGFTKALFTAAEFFADSDDIVVRYAKPEDKETKEIITCFQILKSKAKVLCTYLKESKEKLVLTVSSNKEIKSCVKFLNSLSIKGEDGINLISKEYDCASDIKESLGKVENKVAYLEIGVTEEYDNPILDWYLIDADNDYDNYEEFKVKIDNILKSE